MCVSARSRDARPIGLGSRNLSAAVRAAVVDAAAVRAPGTSLAATTATAPCSRAWRLRTSASSLAEASCGWMRPPRRQSVPATTFSRCATRAKVRMRSASAQPSVRAPLPAAFAAFTGAGGSTRPLLGHSASRWEGLYSDDGFDGVPILARNLSKGRSLQCGADRSVRSC